MSNEPDLRRLRVRFTVEFDALVCIEEDGSISDAVADIKIPEEAGCDYVPDTFEVKYVIDEITGKKVDWQDDEDDLEDDDLDQ
jgi:hypothetical protein